MTTIVELPSTTKERVVRSRHDQFALFVGTLLLFLFFWVKSLKIVSFLGVYILLVRVVVLDPKMTLATNHMAKQ